MSMAFLQSLVAQKRNTEITAHIFATRIRPSRISWSQFVATWLSRQPQKSFGLKIGFSRWLADANKNIPSIDDSSLSDHGEVVKAYLLFVRVFAAENRTNKQMNSKDVASINVTFAPVSQSRRGCPQRAKLWSLDPI
jgi:hypothetical protein